MRKNIKISKLDAAKRQIECSIQLYFNECDPVSIHTLTMAAYNVLKALNKEQIWMLKDRFSDRIKEGMEGKAWELLNRYENFFKHADRDPDGILDFNPDVTEISLWEACHVYRELTGESPTAMVTYNVWFKKKYESLFIFTPEEIDKNRESDEFFEGMGRKEYYRLMTTTLNQINT